MTSIAAQVSVYPLRTERLGPAIEAALDRFAAHALASQPGPMSTIIAGDLDAVFAGLRDAFAALAEQGEAVMVVTVSNGCPVPVQTVADTRP